MHAPGCGALSSVSSADLADLSSAAPWRLSGSPEITRDHARLREITRDYFATSPFPQVLHAALDHFATEIGKYGCHQIECGAQTIQFFESWAHHLGARSSRDMAEIWPR